MCFYMCQKPWKQKYKIFLDNLNIAERDLSVWESKTQQLLA